MNLAPIHCNRGRDYLAQTLAAARPFRSTYLVYSGYIILYPMRGRILSASASPLVHLLCPDVREESITERKESELLDVLENQSRVKLRGLGTMQRAKEIGNQTLDILKSSLRCIGER